MTNNLEHHIFQPVDTDWTGQISALIDLEELRVLKVHEQGMDGPPKGWESNPKVFPYQSLSKETFGLAERSQDETG